MSPPRNLSDLFALVGGSAREGKKILEQATQLLDGAASVGHKADTLAQLLEKGGGVGVPFEVIVYLLDQSLQSAIGKMRVRKAHVEKAGGEYTVVVTYQGGGQDEIFTTENPRFAQLGAALILVWRDYGGTP